MDQQVTSPVSLVWDGRTLTVPAAMGTAREDQLQGSPRDALVELAGRICYDSLGGSRSRNSTDYHAHINETKHHSTHEHAVITVAITMHGQDYGPFLEAVVNRPGLWLERRSMTIPTPFPAANDLVTVRLTTNLRAIREWDVVSSQIHANNFYRAPLGTLLAKCASIAAPMACGDLAKRGEFTPMDLIPVFQMVPPESDDEAWASLHFHRVSRGLSHELVRHGDWTGISQRSTRFVAESESDWIPHPAIACRPALLAKFANTQLACGAIYDQMASTIEAELKQDPASAPGARKQARGAARGVLGNALETQLIFSASIRQWKWMLKKRCSDPADAEIRVAFAAVRNVLAAAFPERFADPAWDLLPAADGFGSVVRCQE